MRTEAILPEWHTVATDEGKEPTTSHGTGILHATHERTIFSGTTWIDGTVMEQVRRTLTWNERALEDPGGSMADVGSMHLFDRSDVLTRETRAASHVARHQVFDSSHVPASTMGGVASLRHPDTVVEIELEADIPAGERNTDVGTE